MISISARRPFGFALNNPATFIAIHVLRYGRAITVVAVAAAWMFQAGGALAQDVRQNDVQQNDVRQNDVRQNDHRQNDPGQFDFYLLSLSWSPSFCEAAAERSANQSSGDQQCGERGARNAGRQRGVDEQQQADGVEQDTPRDTVSLWGHRHACFRDHDIFRRERISDGSDVIAILDIGLRTVSGAIAEAAMLARHRRRN